MAENAAGEAAPVTDPLAKFRPPADLPIAQPSALPGHVPVEGRRGARAARSLPGRLLGRAPGLDAAIRARRPPTIEHLMSQSCSEIQFASPVFVAWRDRLRLPDLLHRKIWEWVYIARAFEQARVLRPGARLLGFGVGTEPLTGAFAATGASVLATDQPAGTEAIAAGRWDVTKQHASELAHLDPHRLCDPDLLRELVRFSPIDMTALPRDLGMFDGHWSSCVIEHLGSARAAFDFILESVQHLVVGGVAVHTTEINVLSSSTGAAVPDTVIFCRRELEELAGELRAAGCSIDLNFTIDRRGAADGVVDSSPYTGAQHLKLLIDRTVSTSFGLLVTRRR